MVRIKNRYLLVQLLYPGHLPTKIEAVAEAQTTMLASSACASKALIRLYAPTPDTVTSYTLIRAIRNSVSLLFGEYGAAIAAAGLKVNYWSNATSCAIVRCRREAVRIVWAALSFITSLSTEAVGKDSRSEKGRPAQADMLPCTLRVVRNSGTIKKCEEAAILRARSLMTRAKALEEADKAGADVRTAIGLGPGSLDEASDDQLDASSEDSDTGAGEVDVGNEGG